MLNFIKKIKDNRLQNIIDSVALGDTKAFELVKNQFPEYDPSFLWLLCYSREGKLIERKYIEENYKKFCLIFDPSFPKIFASNGNFESRMWEMILCDILSSSGKLEPKTKDGVDFVLKSNTNEDIQIEATTSNESDDQELRAIRPDYSVNKIFELSGDIENLEKPILLRVFGSFIRKANKKNYNTQKPLIIAINSSKVVGTSSDDEYILRRLLFGLGYYTITQTKDGSRYLGFQQNALLNKPNKDSFDVAVFRDSRYSHISGVIYTSQQSLGFTPANGYSWSNSGIMFARNPMAVNPVKMAFPLFKEIICHEGIYQTLEAKENFKSVVNLD